MTTAIIGLGAKDFRSNRYNRNAAAANGNPGDTFGTDYEAA